jgi:hypothetical protein
LTLTLIGTVDLEQKNENFKLAMPGVPLKPSKIIIIN